MKPNLLYRFTKKTCLSILLVSNISNAMQDPQQPRKEFAEALDVIHIDDCYKKIKKHPGEYRRICRQVSEELIKVAEAKDYEMVKRRIKFLFNVRFIDILDAKALILTIKKCRIGDTRLLIDQIIYYMEDYKKFGYTRFWYAIAAGNEALTQLYLDAGASLYQAGKGATAPILLCTATPNIMRLFINAGANINYEDDRGIIPLICAPESTTQLLIDAGADVNHLDKNGWTPLRHAAAQENLPKCEILIEAMLREARIERVRTFLCCMQRNGFRRDVRSLFKVPLLAIMAEPADDEPFAESLVYKEISKVENQKIKQCLIDTFDKDKTVAQQSWLCQIQ